MLTLRPPDRKSRLIGKDPDAGKDWGQEGKAATEDEMVWWQHWLNEHEFEQMPGDSEGKGSLECHKPRGRQGVGHDWVTEQQKAFRAFEHEMSILPVWHFAIKHCTFLCCNPVSMFGINSWQFFFFTKFDHIPLKAYRTYLPKGSTIALHYPNTRKAQQVFVAKDWKA